MVAPTDKVSNAHYTTYDLIFIQSLEGRESKNTDPYVSGILIGCSKLSSGGAFGMLKQNESFSHLVVFFLF